MSSLYHSYSITKSLDYSIITETQEKDLKTNHMKIIEVFKEEINPLKKPKKAQKCEKINKLFKKTRKHKQNIGGKE